MDFESGNISRIVRATLEPSFKQIEKEFTKILTENEELRKRIKTVTKSSTYEFTRKNPKIEKSTPRKSYSIKKGSMKASYVDLSILAQFRDHNDVVNEINNSKSLVATCSTDRSVRFWDLATAKSVSSYQAHTGSVNSVRFHPQLDLALTASGDCSAHIFSVNLSQNLGKNIPLLQLKGHKDTLSAADWLPTQDHVITASYDQTLHVYSAETGEVVTRLAGHSQAVRNVVTENCLALSSSADCTFKLWDLRIGGCLVKTYSFHSQPVNTVIFGPNDLVISAADDRTVRIFDLRQSMTCLSTTSLPAAVNRISINRRTCIIAVPLDSGCIYLIDSDGNHLGKVKNSSHASHIHAVTSVCWAEDHSQWTLLSAGADSRAFTWGMPP